MTTLAEPAVRDLLSVHEACALLGVSPATLRRWSDAGDVPAFTTPGGHRRFARQDILDLLVPPPRASATEEPEEPERRMPSVVAVVAHARAVPSVERERFAAALDVIAARREVFVLHTCQRVEAYVAEGATELRLPSAPAGAVRLHDADAVRHLISVACGLESAVVGEDQVLHQVREAFSRRRGAGPLDPVIDRMVQVSLRAGRRAHGWLGAERRSLADVALDRIEAVGGPLAGRPLLVVGAGAMGALAARAGARRGARVGVTNRTGARAEAVARESGGTALDWGTALDRGTAPAAGWAGVVVALSAPWPLPAGAATALAAAGTVLVDLSSPPAVPDDVQRRLGPRFVGVDDLAWGLDLPLAPDLGDRLDQLVSESGRDFCRWLRARASHPTLHRLTETVEARRVAEVEWLLRRLPDLDERERAIVEQMSTRLVAAILHAPRAALAADPTGDLDRAARALFGV